MFEAEPQYVTFPFNVAQLTEALGSQDAVIDFLDVNIANSTIPFPFRRLFLQESKIMMENLKAYVPKIIEEKYFLKSYVSKSKPKLFFPPNFQGKETYIYSSDDDYAKIDDFSDIFMEDVRLQTHRPDTPSVFDYWLQPELRREYLKKLLIGDPKSKLAPATTIDFPSLREALYHMTFESKQFRPTWAKGLLTLMKIPPKGKMLDISAGWGDRLLTAISMDLDYLGFDPNTKLISGHEAIIKMFGDSARHRVVYKPFEDATPEEIGSDYDVVLTSPPYFTTEIYSEDPAQSTARYPAYVDWMNRFMFPSLQKAWNALKPDGYLALHLSDPRGLMLAEPTNLFIEEFLPSASYEGVIGVTGIKCEARPVWCWRKASGTPNIWHPRVKRSLSALYPDITHDRNFPCRRRR